MENISSASANKPVNEEEDCVTNADNQHIQQEDEPEDASKPRRRRRKKKGDADTATTTAAAAAPKVPPQTSRLWVDDPSFERKIVAAGWGTMLDGASVSTHTTDSRDDTVEPESRWTDPAVAVLLQDAMRREQEKLAAIRRVAVEGVDPRAVWVPATSMSAANQKQQQQQQQKKNVDTLQNGTTAARSAWDEPVVGVQFLNSLLPAVKSDWSGVVEPDATDLSAARARLDELD
ncbi:hypothetical protein HDU80_011707 [Chytriomyces hyalinus]|nr:hypothetical protein HDU80_011707 [Chytriomyces hyalinus]